MTDSKAIEKLDKGLTLQQREFFDRLITGDTPGKMLATAEAMGIDQPRRFIFELTARPETAKFAQAYIAAKLAEGAFEAADLLLSCLSGNKVSQQQWQSMNFILTHSMPQKDKNVSDRDTPLEQMTPEQLQAFIEAKQAERRKLELQADKAESLKAGQAKPVERADNTEPTDIFG